MRERTLGRIHTDAVTATSLLEKSLTLNSLESPHWGEAIQLQSLQQGSCAEL